MWTVSSTSAVVIQNNGVLNFNLANEKSSKQILLTELNINTPLLFYMTADSFKKISNTFINIIIIHYHLILYDILVIFQAEFSHIDNFNDIKITG